MPTTQVATATLGEQFAALWQQAFDVWVAGGGAMFAIAINALLMFGLGVDMWLRLRGKGFGSVPEKIWRLWIEHGKHREGKIGRLLDAATGAQSLAQSTSIFQGIRTAEIAPFTRDLKVMKICVAVGPLLGLFGTVTGMLTTFGALAGGSGGEKTMSAVAKGISEALITTETGLVVALPGLLFQYQLTRQKDRYVAFLAHLETVCTQFLYRRLRRDTTAA